MTFKKINSGCKTHKIYTSGRYTIEKTEPGPWVVYRGTQRIAESPTLRAAKMVCSEDASGPGSCRIHANIMLACEGVVMC